MTTTITHSYTATPQEIYMTVDYLFKLINYKKSNIYKLSKIDKEDFYFIDGIFFKDIILHHIGFDINLPSREISFDEFFNIITQRRFNYDVPHESKAKFRDLMFSLYTNSENTFKEKIKTINLRLINTDVIKNFISFEIINNDVFLILHQGFINLCLQSPSKVILSLLEELFNFLVKNYGKDIIFKSLNTDIYGSQNISMFFTSYLRKIEAYSKARYISMS